MSTGSTRESYDQVPYPGLTYNQTHPDRLATLAKLMGMETTPVESCRFLDIGCGNGVNLLPMAFTLPDSEFVGIDYSPIQIEEGQQAIKELGLDNVQLICADLSEMPAGFPQFDYIAAHGVYSWVSEQVRDKLLEAIAAYLAPKGVAYVSYNVFPGWRVLQIMRDAMRFHSRKTDNPKERAAKAREMVEFLSSSLKNADSIYGAFIESYYDLLRNKMDFGKGADSLLLHDELEEFNQPIYFYEFAEHAASHGLQYLSESSLHSVMPTNLPKEVTKKLARIVTGVIETEQYLDFLKNRTFRQTLLCHEEISLNRRLRPAAIFPFRIYSQAKAQSDNPDLSPGQVEHFEALDEAVFSSDHPLTKSAFLTLRELAPQSIPFVDLIKMAASKVELPPDVNMDMEATRVAAGILQAYSYSLGLVELHTYQPQFVNRISDQPKVSQVARWQHRNQLKVTNLRHERIELDGFSDMIFPYLDGRHTREGLVQIMLDLHKQGVYRLERKKAGKGKSLKKLVAQELDRNLDFLRRTVFFIA